MAKNGFTTKYQPVATGGVLGVFQRLFVATPSYNEFVQSMRYSPS